MDDIRILGYCPICGYEITDEDDAYISEDGEYYCSVECVMEQYHIHKMEA